MDFIYNNKNIGTTYDDIFQTAITIAKENPDDCINFQNAYAKFIQESNKKDELSFEYCFECTKENLGYYAGYFDSKIRKLMKKYYNAVHPIYDKLT